MDTDRDWHSSLKNEPGKLSQARMDNLSSTVQTRVGRQCGLRDLHIVVSRRTLVMRSTPTFLRGTRRSAMRFGLLEAETLETRGAWSEPGIAPPFTKGFNLPAAASEISTALPRGRDVDLDLEWWGWCRSVRQATDRLTSCFRCFRSLTHQHERCPQVHSGRRPGEFQPNMTHPKLPNHDSHEKPLVHRSVSRRRCLLKEPVPRWIFEGSAQLGKTARGCYKERAASAVRRAARDTQKHLPIFNEMITGLFSRNVNSQFLHCETSLHNLAQGLFFPWR